jgi:hypothetical protein
MRRRNPITTCQAISWIRGAAGGALLVVAVCISAAPAETIVMRTGEKFTSVRVWDEGDNLRFNLQGLIVSVDKADVDALLPDQPAGHAAQVVAGPSFLGPSATQAEPVRNGASPLKLTSYDLPDQLPPATPARQGPLRPTTPATRTQSGTGLPGIEWQMRPAEIGGLIKTAPDPHDPEIEQYRQPAAVLTFGNARLEGMVYAFWHDRLYAILVWVEGRYGYEALRQTVFSIYGQGWKNKPHGERYLWQDVENDRLLEFSEHSGIFWMRSRALEQERRASRP